MLVLDRTRAGSDFSSFSPVSFRSFPGLGDLRKFPCRFRERRVVLDVLPRPCGYGLSRKSPRSRTCSIRRKHGRRIAHGLGNPQRETVFEAPEVNGIVLEGEGRGAFQCGDFRKSLLRKAVGEFWSIFPGWPVASSPMRLDFQHVLRFGTFATNSEENGLFPALPWIFDSPDRCEMQRFFSVLPRKYLGFGGGSYFAFQSGIL